MLPSEAAQVLRVAELVKGLHAHMGELKERIGRLSDHLGDARASWILHTPGGSLKAATLTITGAAAQRMIEEAMAGLRTELASAGESLASLQLPAPVAAGGE